MQKAVQNTPAHVAIIMDGNGRWAKRRGMIRSFGHRSAVEAVRAAIEAAGEAGVKYLTLYAFSEENWNRPQEEVNSLMQLLIDAVEKETPRLCKNGVRLRCIGNIAALPSKTRGKLQECMNITAGGKLVDVILALSYSGRWDIVEAAKKIAEAMAKGELNPTSLDNACFENYLSTAGIPEPDLLIRTGGEQRISNFLLWQLAYTELYFTDLLWPDFRREHFTEALKYYYSRERRFGKTSEQIAPKE